MIIVEGVDGAGKSTLIQKLGYERRAFKSLRGGVGGETRRGWSSGQSALVEYVRKVADAKYAESINPMGSDAYGTRIAFDRFHLSEIVYGPILRHQQEMSTSDLTMLNNYLHDCHVPVILCLPPFPVTLANVLQEGRDRPTYQTEAFLLRAYKEFERLAPYATIVYDYTTQDLPRI